MKFSPTTLCFYPDEIQYTNLPNDVVGVAQDDFARAMARAPGETLGVTNGVLVVFPAPMPTTDDAIAVTAVAMTAAVQNHMDARARSLGYDNLLSAISYADEPAVSKYQADGQAFRAWRSLTWAKCHELLAQVKAGTLPIPTEAELLTMLPVMGITES